MHDLLIKDALIAHSDEDNEVREKDKFIMHNLSGNPDISKIQGYNENMINENIELILSDDINSSLYNYGDIDRILFKYEIFKMCFIDNREAFR
mgnify:CR=1 FL=1